MPVITISRQYGSYGDAVAELLCDRLGYRGLDRYQMRRLAAEAGLKLREVDNLSEEQYRPRTGAERFFAHAPPLTRHPAVWADYGAWIARETLSVKVVRQLILDAYERGNVVIVGRGGQVVLGGKPDVLHVRLVAPLELRARRHRIRAGITLEEARKQVREADKVSAEFIERYFGADMADPALYDLIINTGKLSWADAADLIMSALAALPARV